MDVSFTPDLSWGYFVDDSHPLDPNKCGKWMFRYSDEMFAADMCKHAVENGIVSSAKYRPFTHDGVACFYLDWDNIDTHKRVIKFFIENNLIQRKKDGGLYNISFKLDSQTRAGEYGNDFHAKITLSDFIDMVTEEWLPQINISI